MKLRIKRLHPLAALPTYGTEGAAAFDFATVVDVVIPARSIVLVPTGLVIEVPTGYFLGIFARSSMPLRRGLIVANGVGVLDSDYCGPQDEVKVQLYNPGAAPIRINQGERIAQGIVLPAPRIEWEEVAELERLIHLPQYRPRLGKRQKRAIPEGKVLQPKQTESKGERR